MWKFLLPVGLAVAIIPLPAQTQSQSQPNRDQGSQYQQPATSQSSGQQSSSQQSGTSQYQGNQSSQGARSVNPQSSSQGTSGPSGNASGTQQNQQFSGRMMHNPRAQRSREVSDLLNATEEARIAVDSQNKQDAMFHIDHALQNANRLESSTKSNATAKNGGSRDTLVPLYSELDEVSVVGPIMARRNGQQPQTQAYNGTNPQNGQNSSSQTGQNYSNQNGQSTNGQYSNQAQSQNQSQNKNPAESQNSQNGTRRTRGEAVKGVGVEFTVAALDVNEARAHLMAAQQALQQGNFQKADAALAAVQDGLVVATFAGDAPLLREGEPGAGA
jgi:hypothetical protein